MTIKKFVLLFLCLLVASPGVCAESALYKSLVEKEAVGIKNDASASLRRAYGWLALSLGSLMGYVYYSRKANKAERDSQAYRDQAGSHDGITYLTGRHRPPLPPIQPPEPPSLRVVDLGPARNMEKRADTWRGRSNVLYGGALVFAVLGGMNLNRYLRLRADLNDIGVSVEKRF